MLILKGRWALPVDAPPIEMGAVVIDEHLIAAHGSYPLLRKQFPQAEEIDLSDCAILPGLVNAHTHLELSFLKDQTPYRGSFTDWVRRLTAARAAWRGDLSQVIDHACRKSLQAGVTTVGDICTGHRAWPHLASQSIRKTCFAEVFGIEEDLKEADGFLRQCIAETAENTLLRLGLSPHSPYSARRQLFELTGRLAGEYGLPVTSHLAETAAEIEFLQTGHGPWREYLVEIGRWDGSFKNPGQSPVSYLLGLDLSGRPFLFAHVNYLSDEELAALARTAHSVVFCPRSHAFFGHRDHRFAQMVEQGINVCLGTDSLASNSNLSILDEMRFLHRQFPDFPAAKLLEMATAAGAKALRWDDKVGTLQAKKEADIIAVPLTPQELDPLVNILRSTANPRLTLVRGRQVHPPLNDKPPKRR